MAKEKHPTTAELAVDLSRTVSPEPAHSPGPKQEESDLRAEPVLTGDPVTLEAQGLEAVPLD